ncbi:MAG TPA: hypothetical protein PK156_09920 [Polyangium sp.]|nr:hypothetical protein [Polyangium sp.]
MNAEQRIAHHRVVFEPPDLLLSKPNKIITQEDNDAIWKFIFHVTASVERFYWIANISELERLPPATKTANAAGAIGKLHGLACVQGSFAQRTILGISARAAKLMGYRHAESDVGFFDNESEARAWIESLRQQARNKRK